MVDRGGGGGAFTPRGILHWTVIHSSTRPGVLYHVIQRIQALADISRSALCCHSNESRAPIANPPNSAQLEGTSTIPTS